MREAMALVVAGIVLAACQQGPGGQPQLGQKTATGAAVGAVLGGITGAILDKNDVRGVAVGAAVGAAVGGGIGYALDQQERAFQEALASERAQRTVEVERLREDQLRITFSDQVMFDSGSAEIRPGFRDSLRKVAEVLRQYPDSTARIVGHTDSVGSETFNLELSRRRAEAVRQALIAEGVAGDRLVAEGRGEAEPRADNATEAGRQLNRRVEIYVSPRRV
ncbi:putative lipoprotein YiaD [bacterium HR40]|nr:putative lipoprotein YiaD [bacterium HR40]